MTAAAERMTIEELAQASGVAYSTIRMYQHRGLISAPERQGRIGYYRPDHLARLRLISRLQERGYSLAAIKDLADTWQDGRTLTEVMTLEREVAGVAGGLVAPVELRLRADELAARFDGVELSPASLLRAHTLGLVAFDDDIVVIREPQFLEVGAALASMGVPIDDVLDEYEHLEQVTGELAERFAALFERNLWEPFVQAGMPADGVARVTDALGRLGPLAEQIVAATLRRALASVAADALARQAEALGPS